MSRIRKLLGRSRTWLAVCAATVACNSIFDIQDAVERPTTTGAPCILNSNCPSGQVCLFKLCSPPCATDVDCSGAGSRCLHTDDGTACVNETQATCGSDAATPCPNGTVCSGTACYAECESASACADGHSCVDGVCKGAAPNNTGGASAGGASGLPAAGQAGRDEGGAAAGGEASGGAGGDGGEGPVNVCTANLRTCRDNTLISCNGDGSAFLPEKACAAKQSCLAGVCEDQECTPGTSFCSGNSVRVCEANGLSSHEEMACEAGKYCDTTSATCKSGVCAPDQPACDGNSATKCNAAGSGYLAGGTACKATETCQGGACLAHVCTPSSTYCQGQDVKACAANGLSSTISLTCNASKTCVESGATASCAGVCGPGQTNCSGNGVQPCSATGQWGKAVACKTTQTCDAGACTACPSKTVNCDDNSLNGCEVDLTSTVSCGTTCNDLLTCSSQHGTPLCSSGVCGVSCSGSYGDCGGTNDGCETSLASSPDNCSACGEGCSSSHMSTRTCGSGVCNGTCAANYGDCDSNKQTNGCETSLVADANHCGDCTTVCKYRSCQASACVGSTWGDNSVTAGPTTTKLGKDKLWALKIQIAPPGVTTTLLQALGIVVVVNGTNPAANIRLGLYSDAGGGAPNTLEAQTAAFVTADGVSEQLLASPVSIATGAHWITFLADQDLRVHIDSGATVSWINSPLTYASTTTLPAAFPFPTAIAVERGHLFAVTTP